MTTSSRSARSRRVVRCEAEKRVGKVKCRRCRETAVIELRRHNAGFCRDCFLHHCREQVRRAIADFDMIEPGDRVLVAVSGGKDSLGLWHLLRALGYEAEG